MGMLLGVTDLRLLYSSMSDVSDATKAAELVAALRKSDVRKLRTIRNLTVVPVEAESFVRADGVPLLIALLDSEDPMVASRVASILANLSRPECSPDYGLYANAEPIVL